jgi:hypothetical protein
MAKYFIGLSVKKVVTIVGLTFYFSNIVEASIRDEFSSQWIHGTGEMERRHSICKGLIARLKDLSTKKNERSAVSNAEWLQTSREVIRWFVSPSDIFSWHRKIRERKLTPSSATASLKSLIDFEQRIFDLTLMKDDLQDPLRKESAVAVKSAKMSGPMMVQDGEHLWPYQWHSILSHFSKGNIEKADLFSEQLVRENASGDVANLLISSFQDLRLGYAPTSNFYLSYEITRAEIMIARTWFRIRDGANEFLEKELENNPERALSFLNLLETVYPLRWQSLLPKVIDMAANSESGTARDLALYHLIKVHRSWIDLHRRSNDSDYKTQLTKEDYQLFEGPHPLTKWKQELKALDAFFFSEIPMLVEIVPEEKRDLFRGGLYGGIHLIQRFLNSSEQPRHSHRFPESEHALDYDFEGRGYRSYWSAYYHLVVNRINHDFQLWYSNINEYGPIR